MGKESISFRISVITRVTGGTIREVAKGHLCGQTDLITMGSGRETAEAEEGRWSCATASSTMGCGVII